jgi:uncharacterized membrane protein YoaK (UPF0700 family)
MAQPDPPTDPGDDVDRRYAGPLFAIIVLLAATSGIVDAIAFARFGVFVANQTGNLVIVTLSLTGEQKASTLTACGIALISFTAGVFLAVLIRKALRRRMGIPRARMMTLVVESALIAVTSVGVLVWGDVNFAYAAVMLLSLSQAFQAAVVTRIVGMAIQTVVINTSLVQSAEALSTGRRRAAAIAFGTPTGYLLGAFVAALLLRTSAHAALLAGVATAGAATAIAYRIQVRGATIE